MSTQHPIIDHDQPGLSLENDVVAKEPASPQHEIIDVTPEVPMLTTGAALVPAAAARRFDYASLPPQVEETIRTELAQVRARTVNAMLENGRAFKRMRELFDIHHGDWLPFVDSELGPRSTVARWTRAATWVDSILADRPNLAAVTNLPDTLLYELSSKSATDDTRERVMADLAGGKPIDAKQVIDEIKMNRARVRAEKQQPTKSTDQHKRERQLREKEQARLEQHQKDREQEEERQRRLAEQIVKVLLVEQWEDFLPDDLLKLLEQSDARHCRFVKLLRQRCDEPNPLNVPPPPARPAQPLLLAPPPSEEDEQKRGVVAEADALND